MQPYRELALYKWFEINGLQDGSVPEPGEIKLLRLIPERGSEVK